MDNITSKDQFVQTIAKGTTVIKFGADWCMPCKMFAPLFADVAKVHADMKFAEINIEAGDLASVVKDLRISSVPTIIVFKDGQEQASKVGALNKKDLEKFLTEGT